MKRKKVETEEQGVTLEPKHHSATKATTTSVSQTVAAVNEGVIDLDPTDQTTTPAERKAGTAALKAAGVEIAGAPTKTKRKYTKRAKKSTTTSPSYVDRDAIRADRIQGFTDYVDGKISFDKFNTAEAELRGLEEIVAGMMKRLAENKA